MPETIYCYLCNSKATLSIDASQYSSVSSDCQVVTQGVKIFECANCNYFQKKIDKSIRKQFAEIYENYKIFHLTNGEDQVNFINGQSTTRNSIILAGLEGVIPEKGSILDVGCGAGGFLKEFWRQHPKCELYGYDIQDNFKANILNLPGVKKFYQGNLNSIDQTFDFISLIHVLEHVESPQKFLTTIKKLLKPKGVLLIQVPDIAKHIFDILVFDHISHFSKYSLSKLVESCFENHGFPEAQIFKEITLLAGPSSDFKKEIHTKLAEFSKEKSNLGRQKDSFFKLINQVKTFKEPIGVFGTTIIGTFIGNLLGDNLAYFIDEDKNKIGKYHLNKKILHPSEASPKIPIYLPFISEQVPAIIDRLKPLKIITLVGVD